jgi:radical SAM superfamily enzyme YgiQ (UPF0313 family)
MPEPGRPHGPVHPKGPRARVLLSSVFGPYAVDDEYGSRAVNPMELYHNQVTRVQGVFSLRMFHRSWGLMLIQANLEAACTLLDFPSRERFVEELSRADYDVVGISSILSNVGKVREMCRLVRERLPRARVVVGGHVANKPGLAELIDADHVVRGEGVRWFRRFLGEDEDRPLRHPLITSGLGARTLGLRLPHGPGDTAATLIPSVGCPMGCSFCSTSAMFGGKGRFVNFYETGDELFQVMCGLEAEMRVQSFFVMDENFLLHRRRALRLLELMRRAGKAWSLYVFSSANSLRLYAAEELVGLGVSWVWLGLEGEASGYPKLRGRDTVALVRELQSHGIRVLGSSIIGLPEHTPEAMDDVIAYAVRHDTEFHQFMLYTPIPGTPLYEQCRERGELLGEAECADADAHGQYRFNFRHPSLPRGAETGLLLRAFQRDFEVNGPSVARIARTLLRGWLRHRDDPDERVRRRFARECRSLPTAFAGALWASERWLRRDCPAVAARIHAVRDEIGRAFGLGARLAGPAVGRVVLAAMRREGRRLGSGATYEPPTFYEANPAATDLEGTPEPRPAACRWVAARQPA